MWLLYGDDWRALMERCAEEGFKLGTELADMPLEQGHGRQILQAVVRVHDVSVEAVRAHNLSPLRRALFEVSLLPTIPVMALFRAV